MSRFIRFIEQLQRHSSHPCMEEDGASHTYGQLLEEFERWRFRFAEMNIGRGSVVGMRTDYSMTAVAAVLALFSRQSVAAFIPRHVSTLPYLQDAHAAALLELNIDGSYYWHAAPCPVSHPLLDQLSASGDGGIVIFTSGSTGRPKAALQSLDRFLYKFDKAGRCFRTLAFLLFDHVAGLDTLFYTLATGGTLVLTRRRDPISVLDIMESHRVEVLPTSPTFLRLLCATKETGHDLSGLKIITYGSEAMDPSTLARLNARFPNVQISQKYGTTETGSPRSVSRANDSLWLKIKSDGVETKVVDHVLWLRSQASLLGYLNAPSPIDGEGWYCTGDLVDVDGEWIRFRGRASEIINVGGEKVAPLEVEQLILELDFVRDVLVSGEPHAMMGQVVTARVALTTTATDLKEAIRRIRLHCREHLPSYKVPVIVRIVAEGFADERQKARRKHVRPELNHASPQPYGAPKSSEDDDSK